MPATSGAQLFTPLDALRELMEEHRLDPAQVAAVDVLIFPHALKIAGIDWPARPSETAFSLRYVLATLMQQGRLGIREMESPTLDDPTLRALAGPIRVRTSDAFQRLFPERRPAEVTVTLLDGTAFSRRRDLRRGDPEEPFSWPQLLQRMRAFAPAMDDEAADAVAGWCEGFTDPARDDQRCLPGAALFASRA